ncbi:hypothetical protein DXG03_005956 [Asterophora parasitica]|uniref:Retrotransposon gag domain-containing protein n=1 Tax=Asterophora parasitica TaxID=117018 RepID=A0A9P7FM72_9AGAR|nr:hypothetical protein DXG03_005956 [Asterophora parasitica]
MDKADEEDPIADPWPTTKELFDKLSLQFQVISECDYARQKIEHLKQGAMKIYDFMVKFKALVTKSGITNLQAMDLLEQNVNMEIIPSTRASKRWYCQGNTILNHYATSKNKSVEEFVECMQAVQEEAKVALLKAKDNMERYYNQ